MSTQLADRTLMTDQRKRFLHYMFTTAFEGGIGYWSATTAYHWWKDPEGVEDLDGFFAVIESNEGDWGVEAAFQPISSAPAHPAFKVEDQVRSIEENDALRVDLQVMERGWNLFMDKVIEATKSEDPDAPFSRVYFRQAIIQYLTDMEEGDSDADVADLVVQLGLFGEHVYS